MRLPNRIPLLYLISGVLILVGVVPLYFYGTQVVAINRERLKINEQLLQNTVTKALSDDVEHRQATLQTSLGNLSRSEERRVGKECRSRWSTYHEKTKMSIVGSV